MRLFFTKWRVSVLPLRIQAGRHGRNYIPRNIRYYLGCRSLDIKDEFHCICICSYFSELRRKYQMFYYTNPSAVKYHLLLRSYNKAELVNLCKFINESLSPRNQILNNTNWFWSITFILIFSVYLDWFNIITKMNSIHLMFNMYMHVWMHCVCVVVWVCVRERVYVRGACMYVRVSQWVCKYQINSSAGRSSDTSKPNL